MKRNILVAIALILGVTAGISGTLLLSGRSAQANNSCNPGNGNSQSQNVMIMDNKVEPVNTTGKLCDSLTITNMDNVAREVSFGPHESHVPYDGVAEKVLNAGQSFTITLNKLGTYHFHDHLHDEIQGYFTVTK